MVGVVVGRDRAATAAADCDEDVWFGIDISPHSEVTACPAASSLPRLLQGTASSWRVVEYDA